MDDTSYSVKPIFSTDGYMDGHAYVQQYCIDYFT